MVDFYVLKPDYKAINIIPRRIQIQTLANFANQTFQTNHQFYFNFCDQLVMLSLGSCGRH